MEKGGMMALPTKEAGTYKKMVKCWEEKQHKVGLRLAKQILSSNRCCQHGETMAMKGLLLLGLGRKEEALEWVKKGLTNNLRSQVCWHAYGLVNRAEAKYEEAIKCFRNALKFDKENMQVLRDLSVLQIHTRDLEGYRDSRHIMFQLKPTQRASWGGLAVSYHLLGDYEMATQILEEFRRSQKDVAREVMGQLMQSMFNRKGDYDYEHSEMLLYQALVLREAGKVEEALAHLEMYQGAICDKVRLGEVKGELLLSLGRGEEAGKVFQQLVERNREREEYWGSLIMARGLKEEEQVEMLKGARERWPRARVPWVMLLRLLTGEEFEREVESFLLEGVRRGVGGMLKEISFIYSDEVKYSVVENILRRFQSSMEAGSWLLDETKTETPTCLVWTLYSLATHLDMRRGQGVEAGPLVDRAIAHTPTLVELFVLRARICKHEKDMDGAAKNMVEALEMDPTDRFLGSKCAKYLLRAGREEEAVEVMGNFTKPGEEPLAYLKETQATWFLTELAKAQRKRGELGEALKNCWLVRRYFEEVLEDQLDFHMFALTRLRLTAYMSLLRHEDRVHKYGFYSQAAHLAIQIYFDIADQKEEVIQYNEEINNSEKRKAKNKAKKAKKKEQEMKEKNPKKTNVDLDKPVKKELHGDELLATVKPLSEAADFLRPLQNLLGDILETQEAAFNIYLREGKVLLMLQAIKRAEQVASGSEAVDKMVVRYNRFLENTELKSVVKTVVELNSVSEKITV